MNKACEITESSLYFLPVKARTPYKFGNETLDHVICARVKLTIQVDTSVVEGWGETPLNVGWVWPGNIPFGTRQSAMLQFCRLLWKRWNRAKIEKPFHPLAAGQRFLEEDLTDLHKNFNHDGKNNLPWLAALACNSPFDQALYDAFGKLVARPVYETLGPEFLNLDLANFLEPASAEVSFDGLYPRDFLTERRNQLPVWHSVGSTDPIEPCDLDGTEPTDDYPVVLRDWIRRDGLRCLKVKLRGSDPEWDYERLVRIGDIAQELGAEWLCADYNCTAPDCDSVTFTLDRLAKDHPTIFDMLLYVEQPFPYELSEHSLNVRSISNRKLLLMDESAHDWRLVRRGKELGWTGVALKTCKTQTVALLSLCWARAHGMQIMVQDLTNPMLAMVPHALLAAYSGTMMGLESNAPQFYPEASNFEAAIHPGLYQRSNGMVDLTSVRGPGYGYRLEEMRRSLPMREE